MHTFRVWAPRAQQVELILEQQRWPMRSCADDHFEAQVDPVKPGARYAFSLDGGPARPDPRSPSQPDGVHGPSQLVDHDAFAWRDQDYRGLSLKGAVLYELHVGTFTPEGTFDGAIARLPHLVALGIDAIQLLPINEFSGERGWGYDGVQLFAPHHAYGGPQGLKRLVDACHRLGLGVIIDVVYNHLGPSGNYLPEFGPYLSQRHHTHWGNAINLTEAGSDEVRSFIIDNALMWLRDYHCDGLRLDAVHALVDPSAVHILEAIAAEVEALSAHMRKPLFLVAECDLNAPRFVLPRAAGGYGLDAAWADEWHHALHALLTGEHNGYYRDFGTLEHLAKALQQAWVYDGCWSPHRKRHHGRSPAGLCGHQFIVFVQNHDQVGNRAKGDRLGALTSPGRLKIAAALLLTGPFVPMLFQGEEWGANTPFMYFTDHEDPELGQAVTVGRRKEFSYFGWSPEAIPDPQDRATFERSQLKWSELEQSAHQEVLAWYRTLMSLRRRHAALSDPRLSKIRVETDSNQRWLIVHRGELRIAVHLGASTATLPVPASMQLLAASSEDVKPKAGGWQLPPDSVALFRPRGSTAESP